MKKYEFTGKEKKVNGRVFKQIRALVAIGALISAGDVGGWIESESNLSQVYGDAWVYGNAQVSGNAQVYGDAQVSGNAQVYGDARVSGDAQVYGNAQVYGDARVSGNAWVYGDARVYGDAQVSGNAQVYGDARVSITPITITGMHYQIDIDDKLVRAGCQQYSADEWVKFSLAEIRAMDGKSATDFYPALLTIIKSIAKPHQDKIKES